MVFRATRARIHRAISNQVLRERLAVSGANHRRNLEEARRRGLLQGEIEELAVETASRRQRVVGKPRRLQPREDRIVAPVQTKSIFSRFIAPILSAAGRTLISGSGTFTIDELRDAEITVFFHTEGGFYAEMRFRPQDAPFYATMSVEEANLLRQDDPPPELLARLFTRQEVVDH